MDKKCKILIICTAILFLGFVGTASAKTWYVDDSGGADFTSIQNAVNTAISGDIVIVNSGTYPYDAVDVTKQLILRGMDTGTGKPIIDNTITLSADGITLENFHVINSGIKVNSDYNNIIGNNVSYSSSDGIKITESNYNNITGNNVSYSAGDGIALYSTGPEKSCDNNNIIGNNVSYNGYPSSIHFGINIGPFCDNNTIRSNTFNNNWYGIFVWGSDYNNIIDNNVSNNNWKGIHIGASDNNNIMGNIFNNNDRYGIELNISSNNIIMRNTFSNHCDYGIRLWNSSNNKI